MSKLQMSSENGEEPIVTQTRPDSLPPRLSLASDLIAWQEVPAPPAPAGFDNWPVAPDWTINARVVKKDVTWKVLQKTFGGGVEYWFRFRASPVVMECHGTWINLQNTTVTRQTSPDIQTKSVTVGTSNTDTFSVGLSITAGITVKEGGGVAPGSVEASLSTTLSTGFSHAQTAYKQATISHTITSTATEDVPKVSVSHWQLKAIYTIDFRGAKFEFLDSSAGDFVNFHNFFNDGDTVCALFSRDLHPFIVPICDEQYSMPSMAKTYTTSQYPPP